MLFNVIHYTELKERLPILKKMASEGGVSLNIIEKYDAESIPKELVERIDTNKISISEASCFLKHIEVYKTLVADMDSQFSIIIEDDVVFNKNITSDLKKLISKLPIDYDLFFFGESKINFQIPFYKKNLFKKTNEPTNWGGNGVTRTLDSYIISKKCAELIIDEYENLDKLNDAIDAWINVLARKHTFNGYWLKHTLTANNEKFASSLESTRWYN